MPGLPRCWIAAKVGVFLSAPIKSWHRHARRNPADDGGRQGGVFAENATSGRVGLLQLVGQFQEIRGEGPQLLSTGEAQRWILRGLPVGHIVNVNTDRITSDGSLEEVHPVTGGGHGNKPVGFVSEVTCNKKFDPVRCGVQERRPGQDA